MDNRAQGSGAAVLVLVLLGGILLWAGINEGAWAGSGCWQGLTSALGAWAGYKVIGGGLGSQESPPTDSTPSEPGTGTGNEIPPSDVPPLDFMP